MGSDWHSRIGDAGVRGDNGDGGDSGRHGGDADGRDGANVAPRGPDRPDRLDDRWDDHRGTVRDRLTQPGGVDDGRRRIEQKHLPEVRHPLVRFYVDDPDDIFARSHDGARGTATGQDQPDTGGTDSSSGTDSSDDTGGIHGTVGTDGTDDPDGAGDAGSRTVDGVVVRAGEIDRARAEGGPDRRPMALDDEVGAGLTARDALEAFDPAGANRADVGLGEARAFIAVRTVEQPRLAVLSRQEHCVQRVYAVFGQGAFHGTERHEGAMRDRDHLLRLLERLDPAQTDEVRQARGIDAFKRGNGKHVCADSSTSIGDSVAYAVALARGVDHPKVRDALAARHDPPRRPHYVQVPIAELLGQEGHEYCGGYELVGDDPRRAVKERDVWAKAGWRGKPRDDLREPRARQITTFRDGVIEFRFEHNAAYDGYELVSMFPRPHADPVGGRLRRGQQP